MKKVTLFEVLPIGIGVFLGHLIWAGLTGPTTLPVPTEAFNTVLVETIVIMDGRIQELQQRVDTLEEISTPYLHPLTHEL